MAILVLYSIDVLVDIAIAKLFASSLAALKAVEFSDLELSK